MKSLQSSLERPSSKIKSSGIYSHHQSNRTVELRRARAQAKMKESTQPTKKVRQPTRKFRTEKEDLFSTRTLSTQSTDDLLNNGQRLTIKLIQLSSAILEKLK